MPFTLAVRSAVLAAYFVALIGHGLADLVARLTAVAVVTLWAVTLLRDRHRRAGLAASEPGGRYPTAG